MTDIQRYSIHSSGYGNAYEVASDNGDFCLFEDVQDYIVKLKLQFEERLTNAVCEAYDDGYLSAFHPNQE